MQVLRYNVNEHYDAHRDYWDPREFPERWRWTSQDGFWMNRFATVLWYLQSPNKAKSNVTSGGDTWFPCAHGGAVPHGEWEACDSRGLKVPPTNPVLFYSLQADGSLDEYSWHCGCRVNDNAKQPKYAANTWIWNIPSSSTIKAWRKSQHSDEDDNKSDGDEL